MSLTSGHTPDYMSYVLDAVDKSDWYLQFQEQERLKAQKEAARLPAVENEVVEMKKRLLALEALVLRLPDLERRFNELVRAVVTYGGLAPVDGPNRAWMESERARLRDIPPVELHTSPAPQELDCRPCS